MRTPKVLSLILDNMPAICKWQRRFITVLLTTVFALRGRLTFTNMARFSPLHEQTFRRHFAKFFDWMTFNRSVLSLAPFETSHLIGALDCTFVPKSGKKTYGLDRFFCSSTSKVERGLEVSVLALIETESQERFTLDATQTPPDLADEDAAYSRIDFYMEQFADCAGALPEVEYFVADGHYAKEKVFSAITEAGRELVTRLRSDANLRYLYRGPRKQGPGAPKQYDGKVHFDDLRRFSYVGVLEDKPHIALYTERLNSPHFKRDLRVVVLVDTRSGSYVVLASTDCEQAPHEVVRFYRLRFQIELLFRDAKQFAGLRDCQARSQEKLDFHFNMSFAAVNVARLELLLYHEGLSLVSYVRRAYNRWLVTQLLSQLGLMRRFGLNHPQVERVIRLGSIAV
jgi:hypothetical protein